MSEPRVQDDGTLVFPVRGEPPPERPGYTRDPHNAYVLRPNLIECQFRVGQYLILPCCPDQKIFYWACQKGYKVTPKECEDCVKSGRRDK